MGEINDSCVKLVKLKSLSRAEKYKGGRAKCCVATGDCAIESLLCIWSITRYSYTFHPELVGHKKGGMSWPNKICFIVGRMAWGS